MISPMFETHTDRILELLSSDRDKDFPFLEICSRLNMPRGVASMTLCKLKKRGYIVRKSVFGKNAGVYKIA